MSKRPIALWCFALIAGGCAHAPDTPPSVQHSTTTVVEQPASLADRAASAYAAEDWPETERLYGTLARQQPLNPRVWYRLAVAQRYNGKLADAMASLEQGAGAGLPASYADYERAKVAVARGDKQQSLNYLRLAAQAGLAGAHRVLDNEQLATLGTMEGFDDVVDKLDANANPCRDDEYHQFDFWLGDWEVKTAGDAVAGRNRITSRDSDCSILEEWTSASGSTGTSLNYFDARTRQWTQVWISPGLQLQISGGLDGDSMVLTGQAHFPQQGTTSPFRGTWTPLKDGRVRQFFEIKNADDEWNAWFEGFYTHIERADK